MLESDALRRELVKQSRYDEKERAAFYERMVSVGTLLTQQGTPVIFDATANRRCYRERARQQIPQFLEVYVATPLEICMARDPKGIYQKARQGAASTVPGMQVAYEPPEVPDVVVHGERETPEAAAARVVRALAEAGYLAKS